METDTARAEHPEQPGQPEHPGRTGRTGRTERLKPAPLRRTARWAAGLLLGGVSLVVLCRALDVDAVTPVPQVLAFLPWLLGPGAVACGLAAFARWRAGLVWGAVALAVTGWFVLPYGPAEPPEGSAVARLRVLTANIEFGGATEELLRAVRHEKPDLVFVQECDLACSAALKDRLGDRFPHRSMVEATGAEGSAILSRYPLKRTPGIPATLGMPGAVADVEGHSVRLQLAHPMPPLPAGVGLWKHELGLLRTYAAAGADRPTVLAGDFNATQDHAGFRRVLDAGLRDSTRLAGGSRTPTWPAATAPPLGAQIDHVLVSRHFAARDARFLDLPDTDHRALVVDLTLYARQGPSAGGEG